MNCSRLQNKEVAGIQPSCVTSSRHNHRRFRFQLRSAHSGASSLHSTNRRFASSPNSFVSRIILSLDTGLSFDLTPWPLAFSVHWPNRLGSFSTISAAAATAETAVTAESFPKILVCLLTVGQSVRMFITKHPSRCFPSFVDVVDVTIAATISDQHLLTIHVFLRPRNGFVYALDFSHLQQHPTLSDQVLLDSATTNDVFANVSDVLQFLVFLQHFLLLRCQCRFVLEHQSSNLGNVIEFPSSYTLLESMRNTQLLHSIMQQASANMTCVSTCTCNVSSDVCRAHVNTHLLFFTKYRPNLLSSCMCPLRGSFMCLVTDFTASAMSTLS